MSVNGELDGPEALVEHLKECRQVDAAIVQDGNADELVARLIGEGWTYEGVEYVAGKRVRYLVPPAGVLLHGTRPDDEDGLERRPEDPEGWHVRETTESGYPLMGSSPAERQEAVERMARIRAQAMRDHPFVGQGPYCEARIGWRPSGGPDTGVITGWSACGYPPDAHPVEGPG